MRGEPDHRLAQVPSAQLADWPHSTLALRCYLHDGKVRAVSMNRGLSWEEVG